MSDSWTSYPKIFAIGHRCIANMFLDPVIVEEKLDGWISQASYIHLGNGVRDIVKSKWLESHRDSGRWEMVAPVSTARR